MKEKNETDYIKVEINQLKKCPKCNSENLQIKENGLLICGNCSYELPSYSLITPISKKEQMSKMQMVITSMVVVLAITYIISQLYKFYFYSWEKRLVDFSDLTQWYNFDGIIIVAMILLLLVYIYKTPKQKMTIKLLIPNFQQMSQYSHQEQIQNEKPIEEKIEIKDNKKIYIGMGLLFGSYIFIWFSYSIFERPLFFIPTIFSFYLPISIAFFNLIIAIIYDKLWEKQWTGEIIAGFVMFFNLLFASFSFICFIMNGLIFLPMFIGCIFGIISGGLLNDQCYSNRIKREEIEKTRRIMEIARREGLFRQTPKPKIATSLQETTHNQREEIETGTKCYLCLGYIKSGLPVITCNCGKTFHEVCRKRIAECPYCKMRW